MSVRDLESRFYVFYFEDPLEGEHALTRAQANEVPFRLQKFHSTAYAGAISLGRGWGRIYVPESALSEFMRATDNRLAPEPELHVEGAIASGPDKTRYLGLSRVWRQVIRALRI